MVVNKVGWYKNGHGRFLDFRGGLKIFTVVSRFLGLA